MVGEKMESTLRRVKVAEEDDFFPDVQDDFPTMMMDFDEDNALFPEMDDFSFPDLAELSFEEEPTDTKTTQVFVEYVAPEDAKIVFVAPNTVVVFTMANEYIDLDAFDAVVEDIPDRPFVRAWLKKLPNTHNRGTTLKAKIVPRSMDVSPIERMFRSMTYKQVLALERIKHYRLLISDNTYNVWQNLFAKDFPHLYAPTMLPESFTKAAIKGNLLCAFLDEISRNRLRVHAYDSNTRPYWKLLYEYHSTLHKISHWKIVNKLSLPSDRSVFFHLSPTPTKVDVDKVKTCALFKDSIVCFGGGEDRLLERSFGKPWINRKVDKDVREYQRKFAFNCLDKILVKVKNKNKKKKEFIFKVRDTASVLAFEVREKHAFFSIQYEKNHEPHARKFIFGTDEPYMIGTNKQITDVGLIGDGAYFVKKLNDTTIVNSTNKPRDVLEGKRIHVCYNTVSNCFIQADLFKNNLEWKILTEAGIKNVRKVSWQDVKDFDSRKKFTLNENYWVWELGNGGEFAILYKNRPLQKVKIQYGPPKSTDVCIVNNWLYVFSLIGITVINLENLENQKLHEYEKRPESKDHYIRVHPLGFALCYEDPETHPIFIVPDADKFKLLGCQICQKPSKFKCSECKTPACSEIHFKCCK